MFLFFQENTRYKQIFCQWFFDVKLNEFEKYRIANCLTLPAIINQLKTITSYLLYACVG